MFNFLRSLIYSPQSLCAYRSQVNVTNTFHPISWLWLWMMMYKHHYQALHVPASCLFPTLYGSSKLCEQWSWKQPPSSSRTREIWTGWDTFLEHKCPHLPSYLFILQFLYVIKNEIWNIKTHEKCLSIYSLRNYLSISIN